MKTLILTCNTGQGHNSSASAIMNVYSQNSDVCETADALSFLSKQASKIVDICFTGIYRHIPKAFDSMYSHSDTEAHPINAMDSAIQLLKLGCKKLYKYITDGGFDSIICVHLFPAIMISWLKEKYDLPCKTALLTTDYTCYPFTAKTDMDLYFLPHKDLRDEFLKIVKSDNKLIATGIPIKEDFFALPEKAVAKSKLGLKEDEKVVFVMGGSMGCGPMEDLVCRIRESIDEGVHLLVSCGTNKTLLKALEKKELHNTEVFSFSDNIPTIMAAADLFVTKPGGISSTEASVSGLPTIVMNVIGACETPNYNFFVDHNYFYGATTIEDVCNFCSTLLKDDNELKARSKKLKEAFNHNAAADIYKAMGEN